MDCSSCGHKNPERAKFCLECGTATGELNPVGKRRLPYTPEHLADKILESKSALEGSASAARLAHAESENAKISVRFLEIGKQHERIRRNLGELGSENQRERDLRERYLETLDADEAQLAERRSELENETAGLI